MKFKWKKIDWRKFILAILLCQGAGIAGSVFTAPNIDTWYATLTKSPINPPNWLFAPMWTSLFLLMGVSFYLMWVEKKGFKKNCLALYLFMIQLGLNVLWSILFFGLKNPLAGLIEIFFLWFFILATIIEFREVNKVAGYLLLPYLAWVTAATILNFTIVWLNV